MSYDTGISAFIRSEFRSEPDAAKKLARLAGCSHRTCQDWMQGRSEPRGRHLCALLSHHRFLSGLLAFWRGDRMHQTNERQRLRRDIRAMRAEIARIEAMLHERERGENAGVGKGGIPPR